MSCVSGAPPTPAAKFVPDPHSYSRPNEARVNHLALSLGVDFQKRQLNGVAILQISNTSRGNLLVLDTRDLTINRVTRDGGKATTHRIGESKAGFGAPLEIDITPITREVTIEYTTSPAAAALQWLNPMQTAGMRYPFLLSQSQAILARSWVPIQDSPQVRFTYEAVVTTPPELMAIMSAENPTARTADGVYRFKMPQPIPAYLLAIAVGDVEFRSLGRNSGVYAERPVIEKAAREFEDTQKMIDAAEAMYGPYRWGRYDMLVLPPSFPYGGMENPRLTFLTPTLLAGDKSLVSVVAHELAHSWSGNLVTNATWNDFWLNEGFTTYLERRIDERLYGRDYAEMMWVIAMKELQEELATIPPADQALRVDLTGRSPDEGPTFTPYDKGALFLRLIEETVGRERFDAYLRSYFDRFAFVPMTTEMFLSDLRERLLSQVPGSEERLNIDAWINGPGLPANSPRPQSTALARVDTQAAAFASGAAPSSLQTANWTANETLHFIHALPRDITPARMRELDQHFRFSESGNSEILAAWLELAIDRNYLDARPALERFLTIQGRRKFLRPLYTKLAATPEGLEFARNLYGRTRPTYHPVSQETLDAIINPK
jgi:aminopeptidase N